MWQQQSSNSENPICLLKSYINVYYIILSIFSLQAITIIFTISPTNFQCLRKMFYEPHSHSLSPFSLLCLSLSLSVSVVFLFVAFVFTIPLKYIFKFFLRLFLMFCVRNFVRRLSLWAGLGPVSRLPSRLARLRLATTARKIATTAIMKLSLPLPAYRTTPTRKLQLRPSVDPLWSQIIDRQKYEYEFEYLYQLDSFEFLTMSVRPNKYTNLRDYST